MNKSKAWIYLFIINYILWAIPAGVCSGKGNPVSGSSNIILEAWTDKKDYTYPSPVIICAELRRNQSIAGAVVKAIVTAPNGEQFTVPVEDNGFNGDDRPMDGRYIGSFTAFSGNGKYQIRVLADNSKHTATEGGFSDVPPLPGKTTSPNTIPVWAREAIDLLTEQGIMTGYPDSSFRAAQPLRRAEAAVILSKTLEKIKKSDGSDVSSMDKVES